MPIPNSDYVPDPFPGITAPRPEHEDTIPGIQASDTTGPVIGRPVITAPWQTSQPGAGWPVIPVTSGGTSAMADDLAAHGDNDLMQVPTAALSDTGAGRGRTTTRHPNSVSGS